MGPLVELDLEEMVLGLDLAIELRDRRSVVVKDVFFFFFFSQCHSVPARRISGGRAYRRTLPWPGVLADRRVSVEFLHLLWRHHQGVAGRVVFDL